MKTVPVVSALAAIIFFSAAACLAAESEAAETLELQLKLAQAAQGCCPILEANERRILAGLEEGQLEFVLPDLPRLDQDRYWLTQTVYLRAGKTIIMLPLDGPCRLISARQWPLS